jgi:hypothetical protein
LIILEGLAASMASYLAANPAADMVIAFDNAVGMYHNPWNLAIGDYKEMARNSEFLKGLADLLAQAYIRRTGKSEREIREMMDKETWLFGEELKTAGFVDEIIESKEEEKKNKAQAISTARLAFGRLREEAKKRPTDMKKAAALVASLTGLPTLAAPSPDTAPTASPNSPTMTVREAAATARFNDALRRVQLRDAESVIEAADRRAAGDAEPWRPGQIVENYYPNTAAGRAEKAMDDAAAEEDEARQFREKLEKARAFAPTRILLEMSGISFN